MPECGGLARWNQHFAGKPQEVSGSFVTSHRTDFPKCELVVHAKDRQHGLETNHRKKEPW